VDELREKKIDLDVPFEIVDADRKKERKKGREVKSLELLLGDKIFRRVGWGRKDKIRLLSLRLNST